MKLNFVLMLLGFGVAAVAPVSAQGAFVTTVTNSVVSPVGRHQRNGRVVKTEQTTNNDLSVSSDVRSDSNTTTQQGEGTTTTETFNFGSIATSTASEQGTAIKQEVFEYSESFDYIDYETFHSTTTGANGESGPDY